MEAGLLAHTCLHRGPYSRRAVNQQESGSQASTGARQLIGVPSFVFGPFSEDRLTAALTERGREQRIDAVLMAAIGNATGIMRDVSASGRSFG